MQTINIIVKGKVQGVFYRATAKKMADKIGVTGWIKNTKNDEVEAMATGTKQQLEKFINWCKEGPEKASVEKLTVTDVIETYFSDFVIMR